MNILCCPSENGVLKKTARSWSSRSSELNPPFFARSQSTQSLSPVVKTAGAAQGIEISERLRVERVAARRRRNRARRAVAGFQVAVVRGERQVLRIHVRNQVRHARQRLCIGIGQIAPQADRVRPLVVPVIFATAVEPAAGREFRRDHNNRQQCHGRQHELSRRPRPLSALIHTRFCFHCLPGLQVFRIAHPGRGNVDEAVLRARECAV